MLKQSSMLLCGLLFVASADLADAQAIRNCIHHFHYDVAVGAARNRCWPNPFIEPDRQSVRSVIELMTHNGWRRQNLLSDHHFDAETGELNVVGERRVHYILTQTPPQRRTIYVEQGRREDKSAERVAAVTEYVTTKRPELGDAIDVQPTHILAEGRSATTVDRNITRFHESAPTPALSTTQAGGTGGG